MPTTDNSVVSATPLPETAPSSTGSNASVDGSDNKPPGGGAGIPGAPPPTGGNPPPNIQKGEASLWRLMQWLLAAAALLIIANGWSGGAVTVGLNLLLSICAGSVGGVVGFLFGIPHTPASASATAYRPSTNLEQVSDWLTKIIIGVGLVQADAIAHRLATTGQLVANVAPKQGPVVPQIIIVVFAALGFFTGYIWTRLYYGGMQMLADRSIQDRLIAIETQQQTTDAKVNQQQTAADTLKSKTDKLAEQTQELDQTTTLLAKGEIGTAATTPLHDSSAGEESPARSVAAATVEDPTVADVWKRVQKFMTAPNDYDTDTAADIFRDLRPRSTANGRTLRVELKTTLSRMVTFQAIVTAIDKQPIEDEAILLLHPSYSNRQIPLNVQGIDSLEARCAFVAAEWYTVIAIVDGGRTVLAYDLRDVPGVPDWFKGIVR